MELIDLTRQAGKIVCATKHLLSLHGPVARRCIS
jgi:hypothetical protein